METVVFFFTLCLLHLAALPAKVTKVLKKKTERTCSDSSSRDLPSHVVLTATLPFFYFFLLRLPLTQESRRRSLGRR